MNLQDKEYQLQLVNSQIKDTLMETLAIKFTDVGADFLSAEMEITPRLYQPLGYLHGGANLALAESLGSYLSCIQVDLSCNNVFGLEVSANHIKAKKTGKVKGTARFRHKGKTTHVVQIDIVDEEGDLVSMAKMTNIIIPKKT